MTLMRSMRFISFQDEFADLPHAWNIATGELVVDVLQVLLQLGQAFALGTIARVVLEPSDPHVVFFVVGEFRFHTFLRNMFSDPISLFMVARRGTVRPC